MKVADERMKSEAESRGELPIHNGPEDEPEEKRKGETSPPKGDKRDEPLKGTPAKSSNQGSGVKALQPPTQPPPDPPVDPSRQDLVSFTEKNMSVDKGDGKNVDGTSARKSTTSPGQLAGDDAGRGHGQVPHSPLFSEEQLRNFAALQGQAAWLYGPPLFQLFFHILIFWIAMQLGPPGPSKRGAWSF